VIDGRLGVAALGCFLALAFAGCGSGSTTPHAASTAASPRKSSPGYGGLGATVSAFYAQHTHGLSSPPPAGAANFTITAQNAAGRVTAFEVEITAIPPMSNRERLALVSGSEPNDVTGTNLNNNTCIVDRSLTLKRLTGDEYAALTTTTGTDTADMRAEATPHC
jgi:hypothetical protein